MNFDISIVFVEETDPTNTLHIDTSEHNNMMEVLLCMFVQSIFGQSRMKVGKTWLPLDCPLM